MHENLNLGDLTLPEGVTLLSEPEEVAVTVTAPTEITEEEMEAAGIVEEPTEEAAEEAAEVEEAAEGEEASEEDAAEEGPGTERPGLDWYAPSSSQMNGTKGADPVPLRRRPR